MNKGDNASKDKEEGTDSHQMGETMKNKGLEDIQTILDALTHKDILLKIGIVCSYLLEWDLIPFPKTSSA